MRLITMPMSHYCEKARWALDFAGVEYREEAHLQGFHYLAVKPHSDNGMVPLLVTPSEVVRESSQIVKHVDQYMPEGSRFYPADLEAEINELEQRFDEILGVETRRWVYHHWQKAGVLKVLSIAGQGAPLWQRLLAPILFPFGFLYIKNLLSVTAKNVDSGVDIIAQEFDYVASLLTDGRKFICGDQFTAADLAFASMAAPVLLPKEYGIRLPTFEEAPEDAKADIERFTQHPAGQFGLKLFAEMRQGVR